jgi:hypothetical protein
MVLHHQRLKREQGSGDGHGGDMGQPFDVDRTSFPVWRRELGLPDSICYQVEGRLPERQSTPLKMPEKASAASRLIEQIEKESRSQVNQVASKSQKVLMANKIVSQHQKVPVVPLASVSQEQHEPVVGSRTVSQKACLIRSVESQHQKAPMVSTVPQYKKISIAHKRPVPEVIITPVPEVIITPTSRPVAASSRLPKRRRLSQKESTAKSGDPKQLVTSDLSSTRGRKLEQLLNHLESELVIIRRASSRAEELFDQIRTLH